MEKLDPELVVIVLDGFDTIIHKHPDIAYDYYMDKSPDKILISKECTDNNIFTHYFNKKVFLSPIPGNCGMMMGKVKYLHKLYECVIDYYKKHNDTDDQRIINIFNSHFTIDMDNYVFHNLNYKERCENYSKFGAIFLQTPGLLNYNRITRMIKEYTPHFIEEICLLIIIIILCVTLYSYFKSFNHIK